MKIESLIDCIPADFTWRLAYSPRHPDPDTRCCLEIWNHVSHPPLIKVYGETAVAALEKAVLEIRGPIDKRWTEAE